MTGSTQSTNIFTRTIITYIFLYTTLSFQVDVNQRIQLGVPVTYISGSPDGNFIVCLRNKEIRKYDPTFQNFSVITTLSHVPLLYLTGQINVTSSYSGVPEHMYAQVRWYHYQSVNKIDIFDQSTGNLTETVQFNDTIKVSSINPLEIRNITHNLGVYITENAIHMSFRGVVYTEILPYGVKKVIFFRRNWSYNDTTKKRVSFQRFIITCMDNITRLVLSRSQLNYNTTQQHFQYFSFINTITTILSSASIDYMAVLDLTTSNRFLYLNSHSTGQSYYYRINGTIFISYTLINLTLDKSYYYTIKDGQHFLVRDNGIFNISIGSNSFQVSQQLSVLPPNNYAAAFSVSNSVLYIPEQTYVFDPFPGNNTANNTNTTASTNITANTSNTTSNTANNTNTTTNNTLNVTMSNVTTNASSFNLTNSTANGSSNSSIQNTSVVLVNNTNYIPFQKLLQKQQIQFSLQQIRKIFQVAISVPSGRRIFSPLFYFFGVFDDLYLYQFHDRTYGQTMNQVFKQISIIENKKWSIIDYQTILTLMGVNFTTFNVFVNSQEKYMTYNFTSNQHIEVGSEGLLANCQNFFLVSAPITLVAYVLCRFLFKLMFNHPASKFFRKFDFLAFFFILLFDGNIQQMSFYSAAELRWIFFLTPGQKILKFIIVLFLFFLFLGSVCFYFMCFSSYKKLNRILMDNCSNSLAGIIILTIQIGFRNFYLGIFHYIARFYDYEAMMGSLIVSELFFVLLFVVSIPSKIFKEQLKIWIYLLLNIFKIMLVATFLIDYQSPGTSVTIQTIQETLVLIGMLIFAIGFFLQLINCFKDFFNILKSIYRFHCQQQNDQAKKQSACIFQTPQINTKENDNQVQRVILDQKSTLPRITFKSSTKQITISDQIEQKRQSLNLDEPIVINAEQKNKQKNLIKTQSISYKQQGHTIQKSKSNTKNRRSKQQKKELKNTKSVKKQTENKLKTKKIKTQLNLEKARVLIIIQQSEKNKN